MMRLLPSEMFSRRASSPCCSHVLGSPAEFPARSHLRQLLLPALLDRSASVRNFQFRGRILVLLVSQWCAPEQGYIAHLAPFLTRYENTPVQLGCNMFQPIVPYSRNWKEHKAPVCRTLPT